MSFIVEFIRQRLRHLTQPLKALAFTARNIFVALLGPSGSGKTTLLRILGGLEYPDFGPVLFADLNCSTVPVRERRAGFVFQHYALFQHMTVAQNIAFGLRARPSRAADTNRKSTGVPQSF